jgi:hypothetical protein
MSGRVREALKDCSGILLPCCLGAAFGGVTAIVGNPRPSIAAIAIATVAAIGLPVVLIFTLSMIRLAAVKARHPEIWPPVDAQAKDSNHG